MSLSVTAGAAPATSIMRLKSSSDLSSRLSFADTMRMLSPMLGIYLHEYELYSLASISESMNRLIRMELDRVHQRQRAVAEVADEAERQSIRHQLDALTKIRAPIKDTSQFVLNGEIQSFWRTSCQENSYNVDRMYDLVINQGAALGCDGSEIFAGNLCQIVSYCGQLINVPTDAATLPLESPTHLAEVRLRLSFLRLALLSNPALWKNRMSANWVRGNGNRVWNVIQYLLFTLISAQDYYSVGAPKERERIEYESLIEMYHFFVWLIHLIEVASEKEVDRGASCSLLFSYVSYDSYHLRILRLDLLALSYKQFSHSSLYSSSPALSKEHLLKWKHEILVGVIRKCVETRINLTLQQQPMDYKSALHCFTGLPLHRHDFLVILLSIPRFQERLHSALFYFETHQNADVDEISIESDGRASTTTSAWSPTITSAENTKKMMSALLDPFFRGRKSRKELIQLIQVFAVLVNNGTMAKMLDLDSSTSASSSSSSSSSSTAAAVSSATESSSPIHTATSSFWHSFLPDANGNILSFTHRFLVSVYFDLIRRREVTFVKRIHRIIQSTISSSQLRDPTSGLSPLHYLLSKVKRGYRMFKLLLEAAVEHHGTIDGVLAESNPHTGETLRQLLVQPGHAELCARLNEEYEDVLV